MPDCVLDTGVMSVNKTSMNILEFTDGLDLGCEKKESSDDSRWVNGIKAKVLTNA